MLGTSKGPHVGWHRRPLSSLLLFLAARQRKWSGPWAMQTVNASPFSWLTQILPAVPQRYTSFSNSSLYCRKLFLIQDPVTVLGVLYCGNCFCRETTLDKNMGKKLGKQVVQKKQANKSWQTFGNHVLEAVPKNHQIYHNFFTKKVRANSHKKGVAHKRPSSSLM